MRLCKKCGESKTLDQFYAGRNSNGWCKSCKNEHERARVKAPRSPDSIRNANLKRMYNIDSETFDSLMAEQNGVCASCKQPPAEGKRLCIDHDHACCQGTGSCGRCIRGLLCNGCNAALGHVNDSIPKLKALIRYLESLVS